MVLWPSGDASRQAEICKISYGGSNPSRTSSVMKKSKSKKSSIQLEQDYVVFLKKKLESKNFKANVSKEEYEKTKEKYEKAKLKLRFLK